MICRVRLPLPRANVGELEPVEGSGREFDIFCSYCPVLVDMAILELYVFKEPTCPKRTSWADRCQKQPNVIVHVPGCKVKARGVT